VQALVWKRRALLGSPQRKCAQRRESARKMQQKRPSRGVFTKRAKSMKIEAYSPYLLMLLSCRPR
jgi:hypothetical protein